MVACLIKALVLESQATSVSAEVVELLMQAMEALHSPKISRSVRKIATK